MASQAHENSVLDILDRLRRNQQGLTASAGELLQLKRAGRAVRDARRHVLNSITAMEHELACLRDAVGSAPADELEASLNLEEC